MADQVPAVIVRGAYKYYGRKSDSNKRIVLNHLNMTVERGSIYGLLGSSGCGKTTLLSCVVGRRPLISGSIQVLPDAPAGAIAPRIGYMPQEVALVSEFSVKDAVYFFGRLYGVSDSKIEERFQELFELLELPDKDRMIKNLSGGQQRRASFAAALVHEPELLILDEPTVGLDPVLRDKIWKHLIYLASTKNTAVLITTHYIEEARQAQRIGLMRGGQLMAEESPNSLMERFNCTTLEEVYLILSIKQSKADGSTEEPVIMESEDTPAEIAYENVGETSNSNPGDNLSKIESKEPITSYGNKETKMEFKKMAYMKGKKIQALFLKNIHQFFRHPGGLGFSLLFPFLELVSFFIAVGHDPRIVNVAIVNEEVPLWSDCLNSTYPSAIYDQENYTCNLHHLSCRYIKSLDDDIITKEFYPTLDEGIAAVRSGRAIAVMHLASNFTESNAERTEMGRSTSNGSVDNSIVYFWMDMSNHQLAYFVQQKLVKDYVTFAKKLYEDCTYTPRLADIPIRFNDPIFGMNSSTYTDFMTPGVLLTVLFFLATTVTSTVIITDRMEGVWDRTIVAGVESGEILFVHVFIQTIVILVQTIEMMIITFAIYQIHYIGDIINMGFLLFLQGVAGMCFGFLVSVLCDTYSLAFFVSTGSFYPMILLCGIVWPTEGMSPVVNAIANALPFTVPIKSMRSITEKGSLLSNPEVYEGYIITMAWIISLLFLCYMLLRFRRK